MEGITIMAVINTDTIFGVDEPTSPRAIREYIRQIKLVSRAAANALTDDAPVITQVIKNSPGIPVLLGYDLHRKARRTEEPLMEAANAFNAAHNLANLAWVRFYGDFKDVFQPGKKPNKGRKMDWSDV